MDKKEQELFDFTIGTYDGTDICKLVGLFILFKFQQLNKMKNFGIYRDDGLVVVKNMKKLRRNCSYYLRDLV